MEQSGTERNAERGDCVPAARQCHRHATGRWSVIYRLTTVFHADRRVETWARGWEDGN
jgi:hypothetical protein